METVTFTGAPVFMENGTFYVPNPGKTKFVGQPSPEIDEAWEEITAGESTDDAPGTISSASF